VFTVLRLLTLLKVSYDAVEKPAEPYTKIVEALPQMRRETVQVARQAVREGRHAYVARQQPLRGECAVDGAGTLRDATRLERRGKPRPERIERGVVVGQFERES
jgi:hypothetical protein